MDTIRRYGRNSICGRFIRLIAAAARSSAAAAILGRGQRVWGRIVQGSLPARMMERDWSGQGWLADSYIARTIAGLGRGINGLGSRAVGILTGLARQSQIRRLGLQCKRLGEGRTRFKPKLVPGWALGLGLALMLMTLPTGRVLTYSGLALAAYYSWRQPSYGLYLAAAGLAFLPTAGSGSLILFAWAAAAIKDWQQGQDLDLTTGVELPLGLFWAAGGAAVLTSMNRAGSFKMLPLYGLYAATFYAAAVLPRPGQVRQLLKGLLLAGCVAGLLGLLQYKSGIETSLSWIDLEQAEDIKTRIFGPFDNPNIFAEYLTFILPVATVFIITESRLRVKTIWAAVLLVAGAALVATFSRGGWLAAGSSLLILGLIWEPRLLVLMAAAAFVLPAAAPRQVMSRAASIGSLEDSSNVFRLSIWLASLKMIAAYWAGGIGPGTAAFNRIYPAFMIAGTPAIHTHNLFLQLALELGVPGLGAFLWLLLAVFSRAIRALPRLGYGDRGVLAAILAALTGFLFHGAVDNVWYSPKMTLLFWLMLGLAVAMGKGAENPASAACDI